MATVGGVGALLYSPLCVLIELVSTMLIIGWQVSHNRIMASEDAAIEATINIGAEDMCSLEVTQAHSWTR